MVSSWSFKLSTRQQGHLPKADVRSGRHETLRVLLKLLLQVGSGWQEGLSHSDPGSGDMYEVNGMDAFSL